MKRTNWILIGTVVALSAGAAAWAQAPTPQPQKGSGTPATWNYEIRDGKRVPKAQRKVNADGSWTEESRSGSCVTTRNGRDGEVRTTRSCD